MPFKQFKLTNFIAKKYDIIFQKREFDIATEAIITAIEVGYRAIDTAPFYQTEKFVGNAIQNVTTRGIVAREELFISTKVNFIIKQI